MAMDFFYDAQIRRILLQFMRIFSLIKIQSAPDENGSVVETNMTVKYGDISPMIGAIMRNNSENTIVSANVAAVTIKDILLAPNRRAFPYHESQLNLTEREMVDGEYTSNIGRSYSIQRYMPVPYDVTFQVDIWTTNTTTKFQILEQIMSIFNPSIDIQQHDNILDWSVMMNVELTNLIWTNRAVPAGPDYDRDVATLTFNVPIWINPPAKVKTKKVIEQIVTNIYEFNRDELADINNLNKFVLDPFGSCFEKFTQLIVTPGNLKVKIGVDGLKANELQLLNENGKSDDTLTWESLERTYGQEISDISKIVLKTSNDIEDDSGDIIGYLEKHDTDPTILIFNVDQDTLPDTLSVGPIDQTVNPLTRYPGKGLPPAQVGQRYLLLESIPVNTGMNPWGSVQGKENDIIEFNGTDWVIVFDSALETSGYVKSISSLQHFKFTNGQWIYTYLGEYSPGYWRIMF